MRSCWLIDLEIFCEILLCHTKVLIFKLFNTTFKSPVFVSQLYKFCIHLIYSCDFWGNVFESSTLSKLSIFGVALLHDILDLC